VNAFTRCIQNNPEIYQMSISSVNSYNSNQYKQMFSYKVFNLTCVLPLMTLATIFTLQHICMYAKSMVRPTEPSCPLLVFHQKPVRYAWVWVPPKSHTLVKYLSILQVNLLCVQAEKLIIKRCMTMLNYMCLCCKHFVR
jgi:hypothetical protein